jgi:hypothetical protein
MTECVFDDQPFRKFRGELGLRWNFEASFVFEDQTLVVERERRKRWMVWTESVCMPRITTTFILQITLIWSARDGLQGDFHLDCGEVKGWYAHSCWKGKFSDTMFFIGRNIVSTVNMDCKLDLKTIALHARNAEYNPKVDFSLWPCLCISCYTMSWDW